MSAQVKVMRLLGAGMVTLAVVPWLGVSPAVADNDKAAKHGPRAAAAEESKGAGRSQAKPAAKSDDRAAAESKARTGGTAAKESNARSGGTAAKGPKSDPPGFNGTVKIHDDEPEPNPVRKNQPKVCDFHVHGFNFDGGSSGTYRIDQHPPTGRATVKSGTWTADTNGDWRTAVMVLPDGHYKLYVDQVSPVAPGGYKHKVFWVRCGNEAGGGTGGTGGTGAGPVVSGAGGTGVLGTKFGADTGVFNGGSGVLAATGLGLPLGVLISISLGLLLAGVAAMALPRRQAVGPRHRK